MVINNTWELIPWADVLYAGDSIWWETYGYKCSFGGAAWTSQDKKIANKFNIKFISRVNKSGISLSQNRVHSGGNSGYQAINMAYHLGAKDIILLGYDMHRKEGGHWHGEHLNMLSAPQDHISQWIRKMNSLVYPLRTMGIRVTNCTPNSNLRCFPKKSLGETLKK